MNPRKKILIVDDEPINLEFFELMLSKLGFIVEKAEDGIEALEQVKRFHPDLILLDNIMPKMSGWEVTKILKGDPVFQEIPIIMFSALDDVKDKVEGFELGVDDYITKPFNFSEVLARIRAVLRNHELFGQIVARDARLSLAEALNADMKDKVASIIKTMDVLDQAVDSMFTAAVGGVSAAADEGARSERLTAVKGNILTAKKDMAELGERLDRAAAEWEVLKKKEIGLKTLENQIRSSMRQD
jgi:DNA-binding response OmpR family regulator